MRAKVQQFDVLGASVHEWRKANMVTQTDKRGMYDLYRCERCGIEAKRRTLGASLEIETKDWARAGSCTA